MHNIRGSKLEPLSLTAVEGEAFKCCHLTVAISLMLDGKSERPFSERLQGEPVACVSLAFVGQWPLGKPRCIIAVEKQKRKSCTDTGKLSSFS